MPLRKLTEVTDMTKKKKIWKAQAAFTVGDKAENPDYLM